MALTESSTVSEQSVSAVTETKPKLIAHLRPTSETGTNCYPLLIRPPYMDAHDIFSENILCLTYL